LTSSGVRRIVVVTLRFSAVTYDARLDLQSVRSCHLSLKHASGNKAAISILIRARFPYVVRTSVRRTIAAAAAATAAVTRR